MARTAVLGVPRVGADRERKLAPEAHWAGTLAPEPMLNDMIEHVARLDADVLSVEASRSGTALRHLVEAAHRRRAVGERVGA